MHYASRLALAEARTEQADWIAVRVTSVIIVRNNSSVPRHTKGQVRFVSKIFGHHTNSHSTGSLTKNGPEAISRSLRMAISNSSVASTRARFASQQI